MNSVRESKNLLRRTKLLGCPGCGRPLGAHVRVKDASAVWNARGIQELLDLGAGQGQESHQLGWGEEGQRESARVVARECDRAGGPGVETAEPKSVEPRRRRQFLE